MSNDEFHNIEEENCYYYTNVFSVGITAVIVSMMGFSNFGIVPILLSSPILYVPSHDTSLAICMNYHGVDYDNKSILLGRILENFVSEDSLIASG